MTTACKAVPLTEPSVAALPELNTAYLGDCIEAMKRWPSHIIDTTITSPPYFDQRSYLPDGHEDKARELGHSQTLNEYLESMFLVFREVYHLTKKGGTLWVNIGDTWCTSKNKKLTPMGFTVGEALDVPAKLSDTIRRAGWLKQCEVIWHKPNANPHAVGKRPNYAHESVFRFAKTNDCYYDPIPLQEVASDQPDPDRLLYRHARSVWTIPTKSMNGRKLMADFKLDGKYLERNPLCPIHGDDPVDYSDLDLFRHSVLTGPDGKLLLCECAEVNADFFAAMPLELADRLIRCSTSEVGNCSACGSPIRRLVERERVATRPGLDCKVDPAKKARKDPGRHVTYLKEMGWIAQCEHHEAARVKPIVFDPFLGSGTTAVSATFFGRDWLGCELNPFMVEKLIPARLRAGK